MRRNKLTPIYLFKYSLIGFIVLFLTGSLFLDVHEQKKVRLDQLRQRLSFEELLALEDTSVQVPKEQLIKYLGYYEDMIKNNGLSADAIAMRGFCYFHLGQKDKAKAAYQQAVDLNPRFFAFQYNLAVLDFQAGDYAQAFKGFQKALTTAASDNIIFLRKFKNFVYIIYKVQLKNSSLNDHIKKGYSLSAYFAGQCLEKLGKSQEAILFRQTSQSLGDIPQDGQQPRPRIF